MCAGKRLVIGGSCVCVCLGTSALSVRVLEWQPGAADSEVVIGEECSSHVSPKL